ncbi:putative peptidylglycine alpha-hydroxylating monooxygenase 1, partial [Fragariocoptes setiger]
NSVVFISSTNIIAYMMGKKRDEVRIDPKLVDFYHTLEKKRAMGSDFEDSDSDDQADQTSKRTDWGKTKSHYYNTDYVDADFPTRLDDKQERLADYEEKEARIIQSRLQATIDYDDINTLIGLQESRNLDPSEDLEALVSKPKTQTALETTDAGATTNNKRIKLTNNVKIEIKKPDDDPLVKMRREKAELAKEKKHVSREHVQKRPINKAIAKNRGLTPYRKKEYNNPRVRHRNKFKKAQKKRRTMVQEARLEITKYSGEATGIKTSTVKSVKFRIGAMKPVALVTQLCLVIVALSSWSDIIGLTKARLVNIGMPNVRPDHDEHYLCKSFRLPTDHEEFIVGFRPNATADKVHHILMYGCEKPGVMQRDSPHYVWDCGEMSDYLDEQPPKNSYETGPICEPGTKQSILFSWAMNAPSIDLPPGVGFKVAGNSDVKYIVLQVHYGHTHLFAETPQLTDTSGITLKTVPASNPTITHQAGVLLLASSGRVKRGKDRHEISCQINEDKIIHPFRFRTHTHKLGQLVGGYKVSPNSVQQIIGVGDPQKPQMFYPVVDNEMTITKGDTVSAYCDFDNDSGYDVNIGRTGNDEMCNFYMMYWADEPLNMKLCQTFNADLLGF